MKFKEVYAQVYREIVDEIKTKGRGAQCYRTGSITKHDVIAVMDIMKEDGYITEYSLVYLSEIISYKPNGKFYLKHDL